MTGVDRKWLAHRQTDAIDPTATSARSRRVKKAPAWCRGSSLLERSVAGCYWCPVTAEAVVDAQGEHIHILTDPAVEHTDKTWIGSRERIIRVAHKQVIVFDTGGPIRCEAILPTNTHGATPAGRACR